MGEIYGPPAPPPKQFDFSKPANQFDAPLPVAQAGQAFGKAMTGAAEHLTSGVANWFKPKPAAAPQATASPFKYEQYQARAIDNVDALNTARQNRKNALNGVAFTRQEDPYGQNGVASQTAQTGAYAAGQRNFGKAMGEQVGSLARNGINADSGLAQQLHGDLRLEAAKANSLAASNISQDFASKSAAFNQAETQAERGFDWDKAQAMNAYDADDIELGDRLAKSLHDMGSAMNRQPGELESRRLLNENQAETNRWQPQTLQQGLQRDFLANEQSRVRMAGDQTANEKAALGLSEAQQTSAPRVTAANATSNAVAQQSGYAEAVARGQAQNLANDQAFYNKNKEMIDQMRQKGFNDGVINVFLNDLLGNMVPPLRLLQTPNGRALFDIGMKFIPGMSGMAGVGGGSMAGSTMSGGTLPSSGGFA